MMNEETLLTERQASAYLNYKQSCLQAWRLRGGGPLFVKVSKRSIRYRKIDLDNWTVARLRASTSDDGSGAAAALAESSR